MSLRQSLSLGGALSLLACGLALSAPAAADHWRGQAGMGSYDHCPLYQGADNCPNKPMRPMVQPMSGKSLGVYISDLPNAMLDGGTVGYGVNVEKVRPDSAAATAGIKAGDLIVEFAGKPVFSGERLRWLVRKAESGKAVDVKLMREGKPVSLNVTLSEPAPKEKCEPKAESRIGT